MRWAKTILLPAAMASLLLASLGLSQRLPPGVTDPPLPLGGDSSQRPRTGHDNDVQFVFPAQVTIAARRAALIDLHFHVAAGLHINSHSPHEKTLIATHLAVLEPDGVNVTAVDFPPGVEYAFAFSPKEKLSVYSGDFVLRAHLTAQPGEHQIAAQLRYQACDINSCMPPRTLPIFLSVIAK